MSEERCRAHGMTVREHAESNTLTFADFLTCTYEGAPTKDGGTWEQETSERVVDRLERRLQALIEDRPGGGE